MVHEGSKVAEYVVIPSCCPASSSSTVDQSSLKPEEYAGGVISLGADMDSISEVTKSFFNDYLKSTHHRDLRVIDGSTYQRHILKGILWVHELIE